MHDDAFCNQIGDQFGEVIGERGGIYIELVGHPVRDVIDIANAIEMAKEGQRRLVARVELPAAEQQYHSALAHWLERNFVAEAVHCTHLCTRVETERSGASNPAPERLGRLA